MAKNADIRILEAVFDIARAWNAENSCQFHNIIKLPAMAVSEFFQGGIGAIQERGRYCMIRKIPQIHSLTEKPVHM